MSARAWLVALALTTPLLIAALLLLSTPLTGEIGSP